MGHSSPLNSSIDSPENLPKAPPTLAIVGHSGAGKTTLIECLLPLLIASGMRVATIKHSHHAVDFDVPGKDSWRHKQAGAIASLLVAPSGLQLIADVEDQQDLSQLTKRYFPDMDLVLAEGYSQASCAKIEVLRQDCNPIARCTTADGLLAFVTDVLSDDADIPRFLLNDTNGIANFIINWQQQGLPS